MTALQSPSESPAENIDEIYSAHCRYWEEHNRKGPELFEELDIPSERLPTPVPMKTKEEFAEWWAGLSETDRMSERREYSQTSDERVAAGVKRIKKWTKGVLEHRGEKS